MKASASTPPKPHVPFRTRWLPPLLIWLGIVAGVTALTLALAQHRPSPPPVSGEPTPEASRPTHEEVAQYQVAPDLPKYITIPALKLGQVRVRQLGVTPDHNIAAPANLFDAGWYSDSAKPGQKGAAFVYGHVSSDLAVGAFHDLKDLKPGDIVTITRGDNVQLAYTVVRLETYPADSVPMDKVLATITPGQPGLNLMTCAGHPARDTGEFPDRLVVYTALAKS